MNAPTNRSRPTDTEAAKREGPRPMHISLRSGERLFLNGAVIRVDRKVTLELLNDATFLLENHVLQVENTTTPIRQLYFAVQAMLMDPQNAEASRALFEAMAADMTSALRSDRLRAGIEDARSQVAGGRPFHGLKTLRGLFAEEDAILRPAAAARVEENDAPAGAPEAERPRAVATRNSTPFARDRLPTAPANDDEDGARRLAPGEETGDGRSEASGPEPC